MLHCQFSKDRCSGCGLAAEAQLVVFEAFVFASFLEKGDQGDYHLNRKEDHPEVVHAFDKA